MVYERQAFNHLISEPIDRLMALWQSQEVPDRRLAPHRDETLPLK